MMTTYNPFNKEIEDIDFSDLQVLKNIPEGYFIEYKRDFIDHNKIAKAIASFANTRGGWFILGIDAKKGTNLPTDFLGIDLNIIKDSKERLRNITKSLISPDPYYQSNLVMIGQDKAILVNYIPESYELPHVLNDGKIYVRDGEESNPLRDRHAIEQLYVKNKHYDKMIDNFFIESFGITEDEENRNEPILRIYLLPRNFNELKNKIDFFKEEILSRIRDIFKESERLDDESDSIDEKSPGYNINYDILTSSYYSLIFRSLQDTIGFNNLTFELYHYGAVKIRIPLPLIPVSKLFEMEKNKNPFYKKFQDVLKNEVNSFYFVDIYGLLLQIHFPIKRYIKILKEFKIELDLLGRVEIENTFKTIPFFESNFFAKYLEEYGIPFCMHEKQTFPDIADKQKWHLLTNEEIGHLWGIIYNFVLTSLGLCTLSIQDISILDGYPAYLTKSFGKSKLP